MRGERDAVSVHPEFFTQGFVVVFFRVVFPVLLVLAFGGSKGSLELLLALIQFLQESHHEKEWGKGGAEKDRKRESA